MESVLLLYEEYNTTGAGGGGYNGLVAEMAERLVGGLVVSDLVVVCGWGWAVMDRIEILIGGEVPDVAKAVHIPPASLPSPPNSTLGEDGVVVDMVQFPTLHGASSASASASAIGSGLKKGNTSVLSRYLEKQIYSANDIVDDEYGGGLGDGGWRGRGTKGRGASSSSSASAAAAARKNVNAGKSVLTVVLPPPAQKKKPDAVVVVVAPTAKEKEKPPLQTKQQQQQQPPNIDRWTPEEQKLLEAALLLHPVEKEVKSAAAGEVKGEERWERVGSHVASRSAAECKRRYKELKDYVKASKQQTMKK